MKESTNKLSLLNIFMMICFVACSRGYSLVPASEVYLQLKNDTSSQILTQGTVMWQRVFNYEYDFEKNILSGKDMYSHSNLHVTVPRSKFSRTLFAAMQNHTQMTAIIMSRKSSSAETQNKFKNVDCDTPEKVAPPGTPDYLIPILYPNNAGICYPNSYYNTTIIYNAYITDVSFDMMQSVSCQDFMTGFSSSCEFMLISLKFSKMISYAPATGTNMEANPLYTLVSSSSKTQSKIHIFMFLVLLLFMVSI